MPQLGMAHRLLHVLHAAASHANCRLGRASVANAPTTNGLPVLRTENDGAVRNDT